MVLRSLIFCIQAVLLLGGVTGQPDPWPPLVTTCDVMPLVAADANRLGKDLVACSSTAWPTCETINCQILSNNDQLEMELLPCWQHPAMWVKNRNLKGSVLFQDIFAASRVATASIGGQNVSLNITVVQRGITLGFGVAVSVLGTTNSKTIIPYIDIPLNITECPGGVDPTTPLMCKMILYMEQFIITTYSNFSSGNQGLVPMCQPPSSQSCDWLRCGWGSPMTANHSYQFLRCAKPQAVAITFADEKCDFKETFDQSKMVEINDDISLNVTIRHDTYFGLQVDIITPAGTFTEIPYTVLPLNTNGCPPDTPQRSDKRVNADTL